MLGRLASTSAAVMRADAADKAEIVDQCAIELPWARRRRSVSICPLAVAAKKAASPRTRRKPRRSGEP